MDSNGLIKEVLMKIAKQCDVGVEIEYKKELYLV